MPVLNLPASAGAKLATQCVEFDEILRKLLVENGFDAASCERMELPIRAAAHGLILTAMREMLTGDRTAKATAVHATLRNWMGPEWARLMASMPAS